MSLTNEQIEALRLECRDVGVIGPYAARKFAHAVIALAQTVPSQATLEELAGNARIAFGPDAWAFNEGVDAMLAECVRFFTSRQAAQGEQA